VNRRVILADTLAAETIKGRLEIQSIKPL